MPAAAQLAPDRGAADGPDEDIGPVGRHRTEHRVEGRRRAAAPGRRGRRRRPARLAPTSMADVRTSTCWPRSVRMATKSPPTPDEHSADAVLADVEHHRAGPARPGRRGCRRGWRSPRPGSAASAPGSGSGPPRRPRPRRPSAPASGRVASPVSTPVVAGDVGVAPGLGSAAPGIRWTGPSGLTVGSERSCHRPPTTDGSRPTPMWSSTSPATT